MGAMIRLWCSIAAKLGISQEQALLLHAFMRGWLKVIPHRQAEIVLNGIIERFALNVYEYGRTYGEQLRDKGVLTSTEAEVFAGNYCEPERQTAETRDGSTTTAETGLRAPVHTGGT